MISSRAARGRILLLLSAATLVAAPAAAQLAEAPSPSAPATDSGLPKRFAPTPPPLETAFAQSQLRYERVKDARIQARYEIKRLFRERGIRYPAASMFIRIFKRERALEVWVRPEGGEDFALLKSYTICALAGELGPKRRQGDLQVPEGFYYIDRFNPLSEFHLSLHVDYPNRADAILGDTASLGGDIFIHGGCNSEGCIAVTDDGIKELYWLSVEARGGGQERIPVHIFPARLTDSNLPGLAKAFASRPQLVSFWKNLKPGYDYFERQHRVPRMSVTDAGTYRVAGEERNDPAPLGTPVGPRGPVPLGTPLGTPVQSGSTLGTPVQSEQPAAVVTPAPGDARVPLGTPAAVPADSSAARPLGAPIETAAPPASAGSPAPASADPKKKGPVPLGTPVESGRAAGSPATPQPKKLPVPLGKPVGGN